MKIPNSIYRELYEFIHFELLTIKNDSWTQLTHAFIFTSADSKFTCKGLVEAYYVNIFNEASYGYEYQLDSFDLKIIENDVMYYKDQTYQFNMIFDYDKFRHCEDKYEIECHGVTIHAGDDVLCRDQHGFWKFGQFKSYNPHLRKYYTVVYPNNGTTILTPLATFQMLPYNNRFKDYLGTSKPEIGPTIRIKYL